MCTCIRCRKSEKYDKQTRQWVRDSPYPESNNGNLIGDSSNGLGECSKCNCNGSRCNNASLCGGDLTNDATEATGCSCSCNKGSDSGLGQGGCVGGDGDGDWVWAEGTDDDEFANFLDAFEVNI